ncbi:hypothetical protein STM14_2676 [Salmonella enterica subsp. enterica serovar Typhimurium str. 14028S]|uniref:Uncharacterized protein n=1 Tax=Salmonella typhimurium (strain 14028s / SGSC 2262) TaxID=588858 RepID=A0A0F6B3M9_SALT1|nr:hypothetical protein STM14_2676 [Salmonella enterica subsp. enterica serovar Typhimurium str. 14028S]
MFKYNSVSGYFMNNGKIVSGKTSALPRTPLARVYA